MNIDIYYTSINLSNSFIWQALLKSFYILGADVKKTNNA